MKVSELFEAYAAPEKNKKLGFRNKGEKVAVGKEGIPIGGSKEWLKTFGATETHIGQALRHVRASGVYKQLAALGLNDESTDRHNKIGSMMFVGTMFEPLGDSVSKPRVRRIKFTVQPNGKIDETAQNDFHRAPVTSSKPRIVPGDPVSSISKSMESSMEKLVKTMTARRDREAKDQMKLKKAQVK